MQGLLMFFFGSMLKRFSGNKPHKLTQNGPKLCIFRNFQIKPIIWAHSCAYSNCPCTKSLLIFFRIHLLSSFPRISRNRISCINWPKMDQKHAFFEIFKPIIWAHLCSYGNCPIYIYTLECFQMKIHSLKSTSNSNKTLAQTIKCNLK